ncbi:MAG: hypothetical protein AAB583_07120 [Patescibacteria group bacterium]
MEEIVQADNFQSPHLPQAPPSSRNLITVISVAVIVVIISSLVTYVVISSQQNKQLKATYQQTSTISPTQPMVSITTRQLMTKSFVKRQFDVNKKIEISGGNFIDYPKEIVNISETDLIGMKCTPYIWYGYSPDSYSYYDESVPVEKLTTKDTKTLTDERLLKLISEAKKTVSGRAIFDVRFCETENGRLLLEYNAPDPALGGGGGGANSVANFGIVNSDGSVSKTTSILREQCRTPLVLTRSNLFYWQCGFGEGFHSEVFFYKIDLTSKTHEIVMKCTSIGSLDEPAKITCQ